MKKRAVVDPVHLQRGLLSGITWYGLVWLFMDRYQAPSWLYGVFWTLAALRLAVNVYCFVTHDLREPEWKVKP